MVRYLRAKGSITVEAAFVLPLFFIGMMAVVSLGTMMRFHMIMQRSISLEAKRLSLECCDGHNEAVSVVSENVLCLMDEEGCGYSVIRNGRDGIDFSASKLDNPEFIDISVNYDFAPMGSDLLDIVNIPVSQRCLLHVWCGYINGYFDDQDDSQYVYITANSEVYHLNRECSHIRLTVRQVSSEAIGELRNSNGAKYYSCETCHSSLDDSVVYITSDGTRFHKSVSCSGLKRTVRAVKISRIGDRRPCSRCGR